MFIFFSLSYHIPAVRHQNRTGCGHFFISGAMLANALIRMVKSTKDAVLYDISDQGRQLLSGNGGARADLEGVLAPGNRCLSLLTVGPNICFVSFGYSQCAGHLAHSTHVEKNVRLGHLFAANIERVLRGSKNESWRMLLKETTPPCETEAEAKLRRASFRLDWADGSDDV